MKERLAALGIRAEGMNIFTAGVHARRSRMVYARVFAELDPIGVVAYPPDSYDPDGWWKSSEGFKSVLDESLSLTYEWLFE